MECHRRFVAVGHIAFLSFILFCQEIDIDQEVDEKILTAFCNGVLAIGKCLSATSTTTTTPP